MRVISSIYRRLPTKTQVNTRRINKETMRHKLAIASFVAMPRLVKPATLQVQQ